MTEFPLIVSQVRTETIDISTPGGHLAVTPGRVEVEFAGPDGIRFSVDWTYRGEPPAVGSRWTLANKETKQ